jgi:hypothetical protein
LEAGNAIQYRTCSWQKVCLLACSPNEPFLMRPRPLLCSSPNISAWPSCHSPGHTVSSVSSPA